jgi:thymidylate synthase
VPLGIPFNIASYGLLLEVLAKMVNMIPEELIGNLGDCHIYQNQVDGITEQITRVPYPSPKLHISSSIDFEKSIDELLKEINPQKFEIMDYNYHPTIKIPLSN